ncbi:uncharacterized protein [Coffea arabica]|uniref:Zinc knuckle CX2CX4HX4C domain-containing protein n=1 Tax=Coffea arabica TaxID=13443 RepID=A0A6P6XH70_COFAR|nr:uncharacterized protein LOC113743329 [Coffea arabica]
MAKDSRKGIQSVGEPNKVHGGDDKKKREDVIFLEKVTIKCQVLGKFPYVDGDALDRKFLRIRVILDITKPLLCGFWVRRRGLSDIWVEFKYEKLGIFCYKCGRIGNHYRSCQFPAKKAKFGPWLQAEPPSDSLAVASLSSSSYVPGRATVAAAARDTNACTTLITVPSSSEPEEDIHQEVESEHMYQGSYADILARNLKQKLIVNSLDSLVMVANCAMISSRLADASANDWRLLMVMAAYVTYLVLKLIRITQRSWLLKAFNPRQPPNQEQNLMALMEILILVVFFAMLKSS